MAIMLEGQPLQKLFMHLNMSGATPQARADAIAFFTATIRADTRTPNANLSWNTKVDGTETLVAVHVLGDVNAWISSHPQELKDVTLNIFNDTQMANVNALINDPAWTPVEVTP